MSTSNEVGAVHETVSVPGTWTMVAQPFPEALRSDTNPLWSQPGTLALLTDGRVLVSGPETSNRWYTLTPDSSGSYQNGAWTQVGDSSAGRLFHPSFVLRDGRFWNAGGEYTVGGTEAGVDIFDPLTNTWSRGPDMPEDIDDTPAALLANGQILVLSHSGTVSTSNSYLFNSYHTAPTWTLAAPWSPFETGNSEASSLLLQDGSVLEGSVRFQRYLPASNTWVATALPPLGPNAFVATGTDRQEIGPSLLLHDGRGLVLGSTSHNGLFTPPVVSTDPGSWTMAADTPAPYNHGDAPAVVEPNGKVLSVVTDDPTGVGNAAPVFYEYDPTTDVWTAITPPFNMTNAERVSFLDLPNGQIWVSGSGSANAWLYTPAGLPSDSWRPSVDAVSAPNFGEFTLTGTQLSGLTTGADFGDDNKMATNYPLVSVTDASGNVTYGRTYDFDQMAPRPGVAGSCKFTLPDSLAAGLYSLRVAANGVASANTVPLTLSDSTHVTSLMGNGTLTSMRVYLSSVAPPEGTVVNLTSSDPTVATVPSSVTVPAGTDSINFSLTLLATGKTVIAATSVTNQRFVARKTYGWALSSLSGPATAPVGSNTAHWTVSLDSAASKDGVVVNLQSSNPAAASVPSTVTVPYKATSASFDVTIVNPAAGLATITAALATGPSLSGPFGYTLATLSGPELPASGNVATWTVSLSTPAPPSGVVVSLQSSNSSAASVPATVTVPAGASSATFPVTMLDPTALRSTITATLNGGSKSAKFGYKVTLPSLTPSPVAVGGVSTLTLALNGGAPAGGMLVTLTNTNTAIASLPATVTIPAGASTTTCSVSGLSAGSDRVVATLGTNGQFAGLNFDVSVLPLLQTLSGSQVPQSGNSATWTATLSMPAPSGGLSVALQSNNPPAASVPSSVLVPAGASSANFDVTLLDPLTPRSTITASVNGSSRSGFFGYRFTLSPLPTIPVGSTVTVTATLVIGLAPSGGLLITLNNSTPDLISVPASVTIPAGASSATFSLQALSAGSGALSARFGTAGTLGFLNFTIQ